MNDLARTPARHLRNRESRVTRGETTACTSSASSGSHLFTNDSWLAYLWSELCRKGFIVHRARHMQLLLAELIRVAVCSAAPSQFIGFLSSLELALRAMETADVAYQLAALDGAILAADLANAPAALVQPMRLRAAWLRQKIASARRAEHLEQRQCAVREGMRRVRGNPELEERAADEFEAIARDWKREYRCLVRLRGYSGGASRIGARRPMCNRARRFRRARRTQRSRRTQCDSGGDGDGPDGDPAGSLVEAYGVAPLRARAARDQTSTARFGERARLSDCGCEGCGRGPYPEAARAALRLRSAASEAPLRGAGPRSGRRGAPWA